MRNLKKNTLFGFLLLTIVSCKSLDKKLENTDLDTKKDRESPYFKATGNEPFWGLEIANDSIVFKSLMDGEKTLKVAHIEPIRAMDANVKMYRINTKLETVNIQIAQGDCENSMSGAVSPYSVTIELIKISDNKSTIINGCGQYQTDYRLHDIWVLEQLNGKKVNLSDFQKELPLIEINATTNKFMGFAGCNQMNGSIFFENNLLRFTNIVTTRMMCNPSNKESEFHKALQSTTNYSIENNRLWLSNPSGVKVVFKKID